MILWVLICFLIGAGTALIPSNIKARSITAVAGTPAPMWAASSTPQPAAPSTGAPGTKGTSASAHLIRLRPFLVRDPQINNIEALRFLVPSDWHVKGGILWRHDRAILATAVLRVASPNGSEELNFLPIGAIRAVEPWLGIRHWLELFRQRASTSDGSQNVCQQIAEDAIDIFLDGATCESVREAESAGANLRRDHRNEQASVGAAAGIAGSHQPALQRIHSRRRYVSEPDYQPTDPASW
jgi:hypothetical protein